METGAPYRLVDLFYKLKPEEVRSQNGVSSLQYLYSAAPLINHGLYVELFAFDAHIFFLQRETKRSMTKRTRELLRPLTERRINPRPTAPIIQPSIPQQEIPAIRN